MSRFAISVALAAAFLAGIGGSSLFVSSARADKGGWTCYRVNEFPNTRKAAGWGAAEKVSEGLDQAASHVASGTVLATKWDSGNADLICVKD
jgi:hypothetical protein